MTERNNRPKALVYRGPAACDECPEAVKRLLENSPSAFEVEFCGPYETIKLNGESLENIDLYAQPGGGDLAPAWKLMKEYESVIRDFVANGGRYAGFCLGAYLAGNGPGFGILPENCDTDAEIEQFGAQVKDESDTVIQLDWNFQAGERKGEQDKGRWMYFQEGANIDIAKGSPAVIVATYSSNGDIAASVTPFQKGWVGLIGPHPEADEDWYDEFNITNPDGIKFDLGYDFVEAIMSQESRA
ncbi:hypothetical protein MaudCBS49596_006854 [Microsporum audouinii]